MTLHIQPEVRHLFEQESFVSMAGTPAGMQQFVTAQAQRYATIIQKLPLAQ